MLKENQLIPIKWGANKQQYYRNLGYQFNKGDIIYVKPQELMASSHERVQVLCDKCGIEKGMEYRQYVYKSEHLQGKYYCRKCFASTLEAQNLRVAGNQRKFGVDNAMQKSEIREKCAQSLYKNGNVPTSAAQLKLYEMLKLQYSDCILNYPVGKLCLDCVINVNGCKIDIEYDGIYWHQDKAKDRRRDEYVKSQGYKIIRIKSDYLIPTIQQLTDLIDTLVNTDKQFVSITLVKYKHNN